MPGSPDLSGQVRQADQKCCFGQKTIDLLFTRLDQLVELSSTWSGPMSIAVFAPAQVFHSTYLLISKTLINNHELHCLQELPLAQRYLDYLRRCYRSISKQVAFHLVYPVDHPPQPSSDDLVISNWYTYSNFGLRIYSKQLKTM